MSAKRKPTAHARAVSFFMKHAGSSYMPGKETRAQGKRRGAIKLAKAEAEASARGWTVEWEHEQDPDLSWASEEDRDGISENLSAVLKDEHGHVLSSLGNITFGYDSMVNRNYRRVVEAELALEALHEAK
jgi:hypothetical protein